MSGFIKNITDNEIDLIETSGIINKEKITYLHQQDKYTLKKLSSNKVIIQRNNDLINSTYIFELGKVIPSQCYIKGEGLTLEIDIKTNFLKITDNMIYIAYTIIDSNTDYQYKIEMSE